MSIPRLWVSIGIPLPTHCSRIPKTENLTKHLLVFNIAKTFDVLGWFSPSIIKIKILLPVWELKLVGMVSFLLTSKALDYSWKHNSHFYLIDISLDSVQVYVGSMQLHGFSDASEEAHSGVVYLRMVDTFTSLTISMTKVAPIKCLTIPRLEICGACLLAQLLHYVQVFHLPVNSIHAWTDSMIVLGWLVGTPRHFKTYVENWISHIVVLIPSDRWNHVNRTDNPADYVSRAIQNCWIMNCGGMGRLGWSLHPLTAHDPPHRQWYMFC